MGVPSLFRWLTKKYPQIIEKATPKNPTDILYIDFNAIIHISCTPSDGPTPVNEDEMMNNIEKNIDSIVSKCLPRKMIVISTDGVAPRAKLNQQRARRYRSIIEALELSKKSFENTKGANFVEKTKEKIQKLAKTPTIKDEYKVDFVGLMENSTSDEKTGVVDETNNEKKEEDNELEDVEIDGFEKHPSDLLEESSLTEDEAFDKNAITPGTRFMYDLEKRMDKFIRERLANNPMYKNLCFIYSNGRRAGEGEQKIMTLIRKMKNRNLKHTIYSPDADLIFLGTSLHGRNVKIMREDLEFVYLQRQHFCEKCGKKGHLSTYCNKLALFSCIFFDLIVLKRILSEELSMLITTSYEFNRMADDWILMSFLAGNDFLPTLQCFDVRFEAIEILTKLLAENFNRTKKYITYKGEIDFAVLKNFFRILAHYEDHLYIKKKKLLTDTRRRFQIKGFFENISLETTYGKTRYYDTKLHLKSEREVITVCREYILGLSWVFKYYVKGATNWEWFYPYDYAPFACDIANVRSMPYLNKRTEPLDCLQQQMLVMPPQSKGLVPKEMHPIFDSFPTEIKIDMFDKLLPWQGVAILPIIDMEIIVVPDKGEKNPHKIR
ncbi:5'-3' exonuclease HKE1/RAT1 [Trachipleistophora hominis]|uniref:5'-3' exonuclease HKE1/RAT1 n=1 Tax=Trachipleistophora hominis TaxID=72359 RepID=L7JUP0_TRAHO|nr:5'-3' exonuclease HKE1/RAT1 [Trachipleistophora hominis]